MIDRWLVQAWLGRALQERAGLTLLGDPDEVAKDQGELVGQYDLLNYHVMNLDRARVRAYRDALGRRDVCGGKRCLDIGTGALLTLPPFALEGGAAHVDAVEANPRSHAIASERIASSDALRRRVTLHHGFSTDLTLAQKVDVVFHEIIGTIASQEGMVRAVADAEERLLVPGGRILPELVESVLVPVEEPRVGALSRAVSRIALGSKGLTKRPGLQRIQNPPRGCRLARPAAFERFDFRPGRRRLREQMIQDTTIEFEIDRDGDFVGFLASCRVVVAEGGAAIDGLEEITNWGACFLRVREQPCRLLRGSKLAVACHVDASTIDPGYGLRATLPDGTAATLEWNVG